MTQRQRRRFIGNGLFMAGAQTLLRLFSLAFQAYLTGLAGAEAMGLFALAQSVNMLAATFATSGISLAVTRLCACDVRGQKHILRRSMLLAFSAGTAVAAALFLFADVAAGRWIGDARTAPALRLFALALPVMAVSSCVHGCFLARRQVGSAVGLHFLDAAVCAGVTLALLRFFAAPSPDQTCVCLTAGAVAGEMAGTLCALLLSRRTGNPMPAPQQDCPTPAQGGVIRRLLAIAGPVAAGAYVRAGLRTAENLMIPNGLCQSGLTYSQALSQYGVYKAMAMPAVMFPSGVISAYATLLVPEIAQEGRKSRLPLGRILTMTLFYACLCGAFLFSYAQPLAAMLGGGQTLADMLPLLSLLAPIWYLDCVVDAAVNAMDGQRYALRYNLIESVVRLALLSVLVARMGMMGYILCIVLCSGGNLICSIRCLGRLSGARLDLRFLMPAGCAGALCALGGRAVGLLLGTQAPAIGAAAAILLAAPVFLWIWRGGRKVAQRAVLR